jgi:hypothetical protein
VNEIGGYLVLMLSIIAVREGYVLLGVFGCFIADVGGTFPVGFLDWGIFLKGNFADMSICKSLRTII